MTPKYTKAGYPIYSEIKDTYGTNVRTVLSSNADKRCWIIFDKPVTGIKVDERKAKYIIRALEKFILDR